MTEKTLAEVLSEAAADAETARDQPPTVHAQRRRKPSADPAAVYSVRVPVTMIEALRIFAENRGTTPSALMREWIVERLDAETTGVRAAADQLKLTAAQLHQLADSLDTAIEAAS